MKFSTSIISSALLTSTVLATPTPKPRGPPIQRRSGRTLVGSAPMMSSTSDSSSSDSSEVKTAATTHSSSDSSIAYSTNWAGAVYSDPPSGETFNAVSASFIVPTPSAPSGVESTDGQYAAAIWVGIDGYTASTAILQTGVDVMVSTSGETTYDAWYEWYPDTSDAFDLEISAGDNITASVQATSTTTGIATLENITTGKTVTINLNSTYALEGQNAEWIVEDYSVSDELIAFADFGNVTFVNCVASTSSSSEGITDAGIMDLDNSSGEVFTSVDIVDSTTLTVSYSVSDSTSTTGSTTGGSGGMPGVGDFGEKETTTTTSAGDKLEFSLAKNIVLAGSLGAALYLSI